jgi:hypothetical protein
VIFSSTGGHTGRGGGDMLSFHSVLCARSIHLIHLVWLTQLWDLFVKFLALDVLVVLSSRASRASRISPYPLNAITRVFAGVRSAPHCW